MSDKRSISEVSTPLSDHLDKKLHTKPGRKLIETEPKSKRTAQNRAAQRAYRERKERKMLELEDKVSSLEDANIRATTESDFLRAQVAMLKNELTRYRGHGDFSDLKLPTKVGHLSGYDKTQVKTEPNSDFPPSDNNSSVNSLSSGSPDESKQLFTRFPWSKDNLNELHSSTVKHSNDKNNQQQLPDLITGGSSSSTSPLNDNILISPESQTSDSNPSISHSNSYGLVNSFDEQVEPFCVKLNEACGTKECPVPKFKRHDSTTTSDAAGNTKNTNQSNAEDSPFASLFNNDANKYNNIEDPFFQNNPGFNYDFSLSGSDQPNNDPLSFLNDNTFDVSLAFADNLDASGGFSGSPVGGEQLNGKVPEQDPVSQLTTEESAYDPYSDEVNTNFNFNEFVKSSLPSDYSSRANSVNDAKSAASSHTSYNDSPASVRQSKLTPVTVNSYDGEDDDEVVPAPQDTVRCSEIWDRITSHPKYTEIDIDGLCSELKSKAKCSERGVVLNTSDVNKLLEQSAYAKKTH